MRWVLTLAIGLAIVPLGGMMHSSKVGGRPPFIYARQASEPFAELVDLERAAADVAGRAGDAERWALTLSLLLEMAYASDDPVERALALDAVLQELTHNRARSLIQAATNDRVAALRGSLKRFAKDDPAGLRGEARRLASARLGVLEREVMPHESRFEPLDRVLQGSGWKADGQTGPLGRQRALDRTDFRAIDRHGVAVVEGMRRRHLFLPPTEAWNGAEPEDIERKMQRSRNFVRRIDELWSHQDGPRVHDFILDLALQDGTGIMRLVHADTTLLAQHDRMRRWRLREALWRLGAP